MVSYSGKAKLGPLIGRAAAFPPTGSSRAAMMGRWARLALVFAAVLAAQAASASQADTARRLATGAGGGAEARNAVLVVAQLDDAAAWEHAKAANSLDELQAFKHFFPTSPHIAEADKAIAALQAAAEEAKRKAAEAEKAKQAAAEEEKRKQADAEKAKEAAAAAAAAEEQRKEAEAEKAKAAAAAAAAAEEQRKEAEAEKAKAAAAAAAAAEEQRKAAEAEKAKAAAAEEEQRKEAAKALEETCQREAADVADFVKARSADALTALRSRAACPKTFRGDRRGSARRPGPGMRLRAGSGARSRNRSRRVEKGRCRIYLRGRGRDGPRTHRPVRAGSGANREGVRRRQIRGRQQDRRVCRRRPGKARGLPDADRMPGRAGRRAAEDQRHRRACEQRPGPAEETGVLQGRAGEQAIRRRDRGRDRAIPARRETERRRDAPHAGLHADAGRLYQRRRVQVRFAPAARGAERGAAGEAARSASRAAPPASRAGAPRRAAQEAAGGGGRRVAAAPPCGAGGGGGRAPAKPQIFIPN